MAACWTYCKDCQEMISHVYLDNCPRCGSPNVDKDYDHHELELDEEISDGEDIDRD